MRKIVLFSLLFWIGNSKQEEAINFWSIEPSNVTLDQKSSYVLNRVGPNMRAAANYFDFEDVGVEEAIVAWRSMRSQLDLIAKSQASLYGTRIKSLLIESDVSSSCLDASSILIDHLAKLDYRPIQSKYCKTTG